MLNTKIQYMRLSYTKELAVLAACTPISFVCHLHVLVCTRISFGCHSNVLVCHSYLFLTWAIFSRNQLTSILFDYFGFYYLVSYIHV